MSEDISAIIKNIGVSLETEAAKQFGAAVEGAGVGLLESIFNVPPPDRSANEVLGARSSWTSTQYAAALVKTDQVEFNPKLKFLFKISFEFDPLLIDAISELGYDITAIQQNATFMVRQIDRPKFDYEYEEVNMYNFKTKVLKSIKHREFGFTLYDDVGNNVLNLVNLYMKLHMPIARNIQTPTAVHEDFGFEFSDSVSQTDTSMRSALPRDRINVITRMTVHQIFVERGAIVSTPGDLVKSVDYVFMNPRFTNIDMDDMDHENGAGFNVVNFTCDFDTMYMAPPNTFKQDTAPSLTTGDITAQGGGPGSTLSQAGAGKNQFVNIIANQLGRATQQSLSNVINKTLGKSVFGHIAAGQLGGITSTIGNAVKRAGQSIGQGIVLSSNALLKDNSTPSQQIPNLSSGDYNKRGDQ